MLLGDRDLAPLPAVAELVEVGDDHVAEQRIEAHPGQEHVDDRVGGRLVERSERRGKLGSRADGGAESSTVCSKRRASAAASAAANPAARCCRIASTRSTSWAE